MPLYEYHCNACGADTEILHKISDPVPKKCPDCGKSKLVRHVSAAGFRLGGGGWYETDFKSGSDKKRNLAGDKGDAPLATASSDKPAANSEAKAPAKVETKSESKAEPKSETKKPASKSAKPKASA